MVFSVFTPFYDPYIVLDQAAGGGERSRQD